jgi:hypothetical protein
MLDEQIDAQAHEDPRELVVTVTTVRYSLDGEMEAVREATAHGDFDHAIRAALEQRLAPWALDQVLGRVLARRPALGQPVEYEGWFSDRRQLLVSARAASEPGSLPVGKPRPLKGLFLPAAVEGRERLAAASS